MRNPEVFINYCWLWNCLKESCRRHRVWLRQQNSPLALRIHTDPSDYLCSLLTIEWLVIVTKCRFEAVRTCFSLGEAKPPSHWLCIFKIHLYRVNGVGNYGDNNLEGNEDFAKFAESWDFTWTNILHLLQCAVDLYIYQCFTFYPLFYGCFLAALNMRMLIMPEAPGYHLILLLMSWMKKWLRRMIISGIRKND